MKKLLILVTFLASSFSYTASIWAEFQIKVDDPIKAASIAAATDRYMKSDFVKNNFNGSLHLNAYVSNGDNPATHSLVWLFPSMTDASVFQTKSIDPTNRASQEFFAALSQNSEATSDLMHTFVTNWGDASNDNRVWEVHNFYATDAGKVVDLTNKMMKSMDDFPGQLGLSQNTYGNGDTTHAFTVGYESIEEMENWQDKLATNPAFSKWLVDMGKTVEWKGSELVVNAAVYDSALTLEEFIQ